MTKPGCLILVATLITIWVNAWFWFAVFGWTFSFQAAIWVVLVCIGLCWWDVRAERKEDHKERERGS